MRFLILCAVLVLLPGCTVSGGYRSAARQLLIDPHDELTYLCWTKAEAETLPSHEACQANAAAAKKDLKICIALLVDTTSSRPETSVAREALLSCMSSRGWLVRPRDVQLAETQSPMAISHGAA